MNTSEQGSEGIGGSVIAVTLLAAIGYAVLRYHIAGDVPWSEFSLFILNKGLCLAAFILLTLNFALGPGRNIGLPVPDSWLGARKAFGMTGVFFAVGYFLNLAGRE